MTDLAWLIPALPFAAAFLGLLYGGRAPRLVGPTGVGGTAAATAVAILVAATAPHGATGVDEYTTELTPTGFIPVVLGTRVDGLASTVAIMVCLVALAVQVYSTKYMEGDPRYSSYTAFVSLFTAAMLLVVLSADLLVLLVGWEVMGICSYFLIGHYWERDWARSAAVKAFVMTKLGDVPFLFGIFVLGVGAGSFRIGDVLAAATAGQIEHLTLGTLLLLGGVVGKSAQFPLQSWLPDAMAGPTPISALIHAATMVAAGMYFVARLYPAFEAAPATLAVLGVIAAITMLGAAVAAFAQDDIKRVLAYSTVSQLAYMGAGLAVGGRDASVFHLLTHGAFKALLFLCAGAVIHAVGTNSLAAMGGLGRMMPVTYGTMLVGLAALAGLPPMSGFFSKESILGAAEHAAAGDAAVATWVGELIVLVGVVTVGVTVLYCAKLWLLTFEGEPRTDVAAHDAPPAMTYTLIALAVPSAALGFAGLAADWLPRWIAGPGGTGEALTPSGLTSALSLTAAGVGLLLAVILWQLGPGRDLATHVLRGRQALVEGGFGLDAVYDLVLVRPTYRIARTVIFTDDNVVDGYVYGSGVTARLLGGALRRLQNGNVQAYLTGVLAGVVVIALSVAVVS